MSTLLTPAPESPPGTRPKKEATPEGMAGSGEHAKKTANSSGVQASSALTDTVKLPMPVLDQLTSEPIAAAASTLVHLCHVEASFAYSAPGLQAGIRRVRRGDPNDGGAPELKLLTPAEAEVGFAKLRRDVADFIASVGD